MNNKGRIESAINIVIPVLYTILIQVLTHLFIDSNLPLSHTLRRAYFWESRGHTGSDWFDLIVPACIVGCAYHASCRWFSRPKTVSSRKMQLELAVIATAIVVGAFLIPFAFDHVTYTLSAGWITKGPLVVLMVYVILYMGYTLLERCQGK